MMNNNFSKLGRLGLAAAVLLMAGCLPGELQESLDKAVRQSKAISSVAKVTKKALRKNKLDPAEASKAYGAYVAAQAQFSELIIQASESETAPKKADSVISTWTSAREAFLAEAKDVLEKTGKADKLKDLPADFDAAKIFQSYMSMKVSAREGSVENITGRLQMATWDDL